MKFSLTSEKDVSALSCETQDYVRTEDHAIILLPLGTKNKNMSQDMTKDEMSSNDIV
jgi:hypothetical protein